MRISVSYSIEEATKDQIAGIAGKKNMSASRLVEDMMRKFIKDHYNKIERDLKRGPSLG